MIGSVVGHVIQSEPRRPRELRLEARIWKDPPTLENVVSPMREWGPGTQRWKLLVF